MEIDILLQRRTSSLLEWNMATKPDELLPTAKDFMKKLALAEAEEASKEAAKRAAAEAEKKAFGARSRSSSARWPTAGPRYKCTVFRTNCARTRAAPSFSRRRVGKTR